MDNDDRGVIHGRVIHHFGGADIAIRNAEVRLHKEHETNNEEQASAKDKFTSTDNEGHFHFDDLDHETYLVSCTAFGVPAEPARVKVTSECLHPNGVHLKVPLGIVIRTFVLDGERITEVLHFHTHRTGSVRIESSIKPERISKYEFTAEEPGLTITGDGPDVQVRALRARSHRVKVILRERKPDNKHGGGAETTFNVPFSAIEPDVTHVMGNTGVQLRRTQVEPTRDHALWSAIRLNTKRIGFNAYLEFINRVLCGEERETIGEKHLSDAIHHGVGAYELLRWATEVFLLRHCGVTVELRDSDRGFFHGESESARWQEPVNFDFVQHKLQQYLGCPPQLPYITRIIRDSFSDEESRGDERSLLTSRRLHQPCLIELIWSYWHEEGMLVQTMNAVAGRFQNLRSNLRDPLANLEIDSLRPLNNILWGFIQDEFRRLTVKRRAYEYSHHYGLSLYGRAVSRFRPADNRSKFLEAFHNLMRLAAMFYREDNDTTVIAEGYPLLNALKEVHLLLAQGAQNQFGDLPWTARAEMLLQQWMLARPEMRDFMQSRAMVPYKEPWMPQVDAMKTVQGWTDVTVTHFRDLGIYGEQILLSVRYGDWVGINDEDSAKNWARYWRPEIQGYLHAYRAATGVDLSHGETPDATMPSALLQSRLAAQQQQRMR